MFYDFLIVGAGLFGAVFSQIASANGKRCLVIDKRSHIGGNCYTEDVDGIQVHKYGPHIFHTDSKKAWEYINTFSEFTSFTNAPIAIYEGQSYNLPFNMNTFAKIFGVTTPYEAIQRIKADISFTGTPTNLEEKAISLVGDTIYKMLVKGYTEKQWGKSCSELPPDIISRLPLRFTYSNNYFNDRYQGIPKNGYTEIFDKMFENVDVVLNTPFKEEYEMLAKKIIYTGKIDEYFWYVYGKLEYRSLRFEEERIDGIDNYQGNAVVNYTEREIPFTRIVEHKHFSTNPISNGKTVITREYPVIHDDFNEPYYPIPNYINNAIYEEYKRLSLKKDNIIFAGRTGDYKYYDMDDTILNAIELAEKQI